MPKTKEQLEQSRVRRADKLKRINEHRILLGKDPYRSYSAYLKNREKPPRTAAQKAATEKMIEARNMNKRQTGKLTKKDKLENIARAKVVVKDTLKNKPTKEQIEYVESKFYRPLPPIPKAAKPLPAIPIKNKKVKVPLVIVEPPKQVMSEIHKKAVDEIIKKDKKNWSPRTKPNIDRDIIIRENKKIAIIKVANPKPVNRQKKQADLKKAKDEAAKIKKAEKIKVIKAKIDAEKNAKKVVEKKVKVAKKKVKVAEKKVAVAEKKVQPINNKINGMNFVEFMMRNK